MQQHLVLKFILSGITIIAVMSFFAQSHLLAQAPSDDLYEENDTLNEASNLDLDADVDQLTIFPTDDPDWFRFLVPYDHTATVQIISATPGFDLTLNIYDPNATLLLTVNDPASPNAQVSFQAAIEGYYAIEIFNENGQEGWYTLSISDISPTPTPTSTLTPTATPTITLTPTFTVTTTATITTTSSPPTATVTPNLGGEPDFAEPNNHFDQSYRIAPGDSLTSLNFNSGIPDQVDVDFFVMAVREGISYTCFTANLGQGLDTEMAIYNSKDFNDVVAGNDDENTQAGRINSKIRFIAPRNGDIYILITYKFPADEDLRYPGAASYSLSCTTTEPTLTPQPPVGGGNMPVTVTPIHTPISFEIFAQPTMAPTPTSAPLGILQVTIIIGYDRNDNGDVEPQEGVTGISIRVADATTNRQLTQGYTNTVGSVQFIVPTNHPALIVIPFLNMAKEFRPGNLTRWVIRIPATTAPGLIP